MSNGADDAGLIVGADMLKLSRRSR